MADVNVALGFVALSLSIVPGVAKSGALFIRVLLQNCVHACSYRMCKFTLHYTHALHGRRVVAPKKKASGLGCFLEGRKICFLKGRCNLFTHARKTRYKITITRIH